MKDEYIRKAKLVRVIDGDTVELDIDLGFYLTKRDRVRVLGVNCPEMKGPTREAGERAKLFVINWFERMGHEVTVLTKKDKYDSFGRYLAEVISQSLNSLGTDLLESGNAIPFYRRSYF